MTAFTLRPDTRDVLIDGAPITLGARAFDVLAFLEAHSDRVVSKAELLEQVWGGLAVEEGNLSVQISALRKVLGAKAIATVPGVGYKLAKAAPAPAPTGPALPDKPSLVVLPFANLSGTAENDYLVDGLITDIIAGLSRISAIFVIAAATSFRFKGQPVDLADLGRQLGVRYAVEGSVQQAGDRLRVTVQLVEAESGRTIWSDRFSGTMQAVFDLQDEIAERVASTVEPKLLLAEAGRLQGKPTDDMAAYDLVLRAMPYVYKVPTLEDFRKGVALLDAAIARDPDYAVAKAWKVRAYLISRGARHITWDEYLEIAPLAQSLVAEAHTDPLVMTFGGMAHAMSGWGQQEGAEAVRRGARLCPNSALIQTAAGFPLAYLGSYDEAITAFERGLRLDPLGEMSVYCRMGAGICHMFAGRVDTGVEMMEQVRDELPGYATAWIFLCIGYWLRGDLAQAKAAAAELVRRAPEVTVTSTLASTPYRRADQQQMMVAALRAAGVPE
jgi:TolB-like protein